jgi:hypothetical protein
MAMTTRTRRRALWALNALLLGGIAATVAWAATVPVRTPPLSETTTTQPAGDGSAHRAARRKAEYREQLLARDLRKPLYDPKPVEVVVQPKPKPPLTLTLTGTAVDPGFTAAFLRTRRGETHIVAVGESLDGAKVLKVTADSATLLWHEEEKNLTVSGDR